MIAAGPDSRLLRAVLEPWCPVPFVAWPNPGLPGWAGSLDLVVMLAPEGNDHGSASAVAEAVRRGAQVVVACPERSLVGEHAAGRHVTVLPTVTGDQLATAVVMLDYLAHVHLGPRADAESVAESLDEVADRLLAAPRPRGQPGQDARHRHGRHEPARVGRLGPRRPRRPPARRVAASHERPLRHRRRRRAPAPCDRGDQAARRLRRSVRRRAGDLRPLLLILDDRSDDPVVRPQAGELEAAAARHGVRVETLTPTPTPRSRATRRCC